MNLQRGLQMMMMAMMNLPQKPLGKIRFARCCGTCSLCTDEGKCINPNATHDKELDKVADFMLCSDYQSRTDLLDYIICDPGIGEQ